MTWAHPGWLSLLLLTLLVLVIGVWGHRARGRALALLAEPEALRTLTSPIVSILRGWQVAFAGIAALGLGLAAAGPRLGFDWEQRKMQGVAIVVVLDVSRSMDAADVQPSRIEVARREVGDFVRLLRGDVCGLVLFAAGAFPRIPLTADYATLLWALDDSSTDTIRAQGTSLGGAIEAATKMLGKAEGAGKAILLVSDGEGHDDDDRVDAAVAAAKAAGVHIYALGVGDTAGAPIPLAEGGFKKDTDGGVVLSRLDEKRLAALAAATGGAYVRAVASDDDVRALYEQEIRGKLEAAERGVRRDKIWRERFQWPLAGALAALVAGAALSIGRGRAGAAAAVLFLALTPSVARASALDDGLTALGGKDYARAVELLGQARVEDPDDPRTGQALGEALYRAGRYREAEQVFRSLAERDAAHKPGHLYNAGNAAYRGGRLEDALRDFQEAEKADPKLASAQKNASAVQKEIQARLQKEPPPQDQQDQQPQDGQPQDGQPQDGQQGSGAPQPQDGPQPPQPQDDGQQQPQDQDQGPDGQPSPDDDGERDPDGPPSQPGEPGPAGDASPDVRQEADGTPQGAGEPDADARPGMSAEEAARLVDGVPDGTPRVAVGGRDTEKDW